MAVALAERVERAEDARVAVVDREERAAAVAVGDVERAGEALEARRVGVDALIFESIQRVSIDATV